MERLISKIQYNNFETGEFIEEKERSYTETIKLIESFPWNQQRQKLLVSLTNPSVTIEGKQNDYLKLSVYFNAKYVLYYLDENNTLYTKDFTNITYAYQYIELLFLSHFDTSDFKKQNTWLKNNQIHFVSQDFKYIVTARSARKYLISTSGMNLAISLFFLIYPLARGIY